MPQYREYDMRDTPLAILPGDVLEFRHHPFASTSVYPALLAMNLPAHLTWKEIDRQPGKVRVEVIKRTS